MSPGRPALWMALTTPASASANHCGPSSLFAHPDIRPGCVGYLNGVFSERSNVARDRSPATRLLHEGIGHEVRAVACFGSHASRLGVASARDREAPVVLHDDVVELPRLDFV